jgi:hypothetical protein
MKWNRRSGLSFSLAALITLAIAGSAVAAGTAAPAAVRLQAKAGQVSLTAVLVGPISRPNPYGVGTRPAPPVRVPAGCTVKQAPPGSGLPDIIICTGGAPLRVAVNPVPGKWTLAYRLHASTTPNVVWKLASATVQIHQGAHVVATLSAGKTSVSLTASQVAALVAGSDRFYVRSGAQVSSGAIVQAGR